MEQQLAEAWSREQEAVDELAKLKDDRDAVANKLERSGLLVVELREAVAQAKTFSMEEFKSLSDFLGAVEDAVSNNFSEGFNFYIRQLHRHHPDVAINL